MPALAEISRCTDADLLALEARWPRQGCANRYARQVAGESTLFLAHHRGAIVGRGEARWSGPFMAEVASAIGVVPEINGLTVASEHRGAGIGTRIIAAIEAEARERRVPVVGLGVDLGNERAERLYRRLGYHGDLRYVDRYTWYDADGGLHDAADACRFMTKPL